MNAHTVIDASERFQSGAEPLAPARPDRLLRAEDVIARTGMSRSTIRRHELAGTFPTRVYLSSSSVRWHESEIERWIATRPKAPPP